VTEVIPAERFSTLQNLEWWERLEREAGLTYLCKLAVPAFDEGFDPHHETDTSQSAVTVAGDGVVSAPEGAVLSFGVERSVDAPDGPVTPETMYGRFCRYSRAFASRAEYEQWAAATPEVVSDVQPLDESPDLQARLLGDAESLGDSTESHDPSGGGCSC